MNIIARKARIVLEPLVVPCQNIWCEVVWRFLHNIIITRNMFINNQWYILLFDFLLHRIFCRLLDLVCCYELELCKVLPHNETLAWIRRHVISVFTSFIDIPGIVIIPTKFDSKTNPRNNFHLWHYDSNDIYSM